MHSQTHSSLDQRHPDNDWALAQDVWVEDSGTQTPDKKLEGEQKESKMSKIKQALKMDK